MIRFGPAGIPLSCKGRTLRDGIADVHALGLTAMEVQLVRTNIIERTITDEEEGVSAEEHRNELIVDVLRSIRGRRESVGIHTPMRAGDTVKVLATGLAKDYYEFSELGMIAKNLDIELSLHTPYYMDLAGTEEMVRKSMDSICLGGLIADRLGATIVVTHAGLCYRDRRESAEKIIQCIASIRDWFRANKLRPKLGIENSGRQEIFGSLEEVIEVCERIDGVQPVLNFAHIHARCNGCLKTVDDFQKIFDSVQKFTHGKYHTHFSGVIYEDGNEKRYTPIKKSDLAFEPLAECILENNYDITIISGSPLLEHDAMYMKLILERTLAKHMAKEKLPEKEPIVSMKKPLEKRKLPEKKIPSKRTARVKKPAKKPKKR